MHVSKETKFKECAPGKTIENLKSMLKDLGIEPEEEWIDTGIEDLYALRLIHNGSETFASNGKGTTKEYAMASAYAEFMERLENGYMTYGACEDDIWKQNGFIITPDEKKLSVEEVAGSGNSFIEFFINENLKIPGCRNLNKLDVLKKWFPYLNSDGKFLSVKYYSVKNKAYEYVPQGLCLRFYYTNGMCAGNSPEEALTQGLSEVFERHVNINILREKITLPDIPEWYLKKHEKYHKLIKDIESGGRYKVIVKDGSFGGKYPVVGLIIIDKTRQSYGIKFGAHPEFEIALERAFTEALQGKTLEIFTSFSKLLFDSSADPLLVDPDENIINIAKVGIGQYPIEIFNETPDYEFAPFADTAGKTNADLLKAMTDQLISEGYDILIRDCSYLGFPAYHVIVPGFSEMYRVDQQIIRDAQNCRYIRAIIKNLHHASGEELSILISHMMKKQNSLNENTFSLMMGVEFNDRFIGIPHEHYMLIGVCQYKLGNYREASFAWGKIASLYQGSGKEDYFCCLAHYSAARAENIADDKISALLHLFYPLEIADEICDKLHDQSKVIDNFYPEVNCFNCSDCPVRNSCNHAMFRRIRTALKSRMAAASLMDLSELKL